TPACVLRLRQSAFSCCCRLFRPQSRFGRYSGPIIADCRSTPRGWSRSLAWRFVLLFSSERLSSDFIFSFGQDRKAKIENLVPRSDGARLFWADLACSLREAAQRCCAKFIAQPPSVTTARNTKVESFSLLRLTSRFIA